MNDFQYNEELSAALKVVKSQAAELDRLRAEVEKLVADINRQLVAIAEYDAEVASLKEERDRAIRQNDIDWVRRQEITRLTQQLAAANGRLGKYRGATKEWATKDMTFLIMHLKEDTNFDANLVEAMLKFAIECAALSDLSEADKEKTK